MNGTSFNWEHFEYEEKKAKGGMIGMTVWVIVWGKKRERERERSNINDTDGKRTGKKNI